MDLVLDHGDELEETMIAMQNADTPIFDIICDSPVS